METQDGLDYLNPTWDKIQPPFIPVVAQPSGDFVSTFLRADADPMAVAALPDQSAAMFDIQVNPPLSPATSTSAGQETVAPIEQVIAQYPPDKVLSAAAQGVADYTCSNLLPIHGTDSPADAMSLSSPSVVPPMGTVGPIFAAPIAPLRPVGVADNAVVAPPAKMQKVASGNAKRHRPSAPARANVNGNGSVSPSMSDTASATGSGGPGGPEREPDHDDTGRREKRLSRNRESAYMSRQRKKKYVQSLEQKVEEATKLNSQLSRQVVTLQSENATMRDEIQYLRYVMTQSKERAQQVFLGLGKELPNIMPPTKGVGGPHFGGTMTLRDMQLKGAAGAQLGPGGGVPLRGTFTVQGTPPTQSVPNARPMSAGATRTGGPGGAGWTGTARVLTGVHETLPDRPGAGPVAEVNGTDVRMVPARIKPEHLFGSSGGYPRQSLSGPTPIVVCPTAHSFLMQPDESVGGAESNGGNGTAQGQGAGSHASGGSGSQKSGGNPLDYPAMKVVVPSEIFSNGKEESRLFNQFYELSCLISDVRLLRPENHTGLPASTPILLPSKFPPTTTATAPVSTAQPQSQA